MANPNLAGLLSVDIYDDHHDMLHHALMLKHPLQYLQQNMYDLMDHYNYDYPLDEMLH